MEEVTDWVEWMLHKAMFWETDNGRKGRILRAFHHLVAYSIFTLVIVAHTLYRALWFQTILVVVMGVIWVQHMVLRGCVFTRVEQRLIGDKGTFWDPYVEFIGIQPSEQVNTAVLITSTTAAFGLMGLEWTANVIRMVTEFIKRKYTD